jgi:hypothetical protein
MWTRRSRNMKNATRRNRSRPKTNEKGAERKDEKDEKKRSVE